MRVGSFADSTNDHQWIHRSSRIIKRGGRKKVHLPRGAQE